MLAKNNRNLSNSLKRKFLYNNDINSIHLLINIYESEENLGNIFPQYLSMGTLKKIVKRSLRGRPGKDLAAKNISELIHNDINRFELLVYLEAYKSGYHSTKYVNKIEKIVLSTCGVKSIYTKNYIRDTLKSNPEIVLIKKELINHMKEEVKSNVSFNRLVNTFNKKILKPKIFNINKYLDKQVKMVEDEKGKTVLKYESKPFTRIELSKMYRRIVQIILDDGVRIMADAYWSGIIEKVIRRYK